MYRSILVPLDGSTFGEHALPLALTIARRSGATVQLAHVHVPSELMYAIGGIPIVDDTLDAPSRESERAYLEGLTQRLASAWDLSITSAVLDGPAAAALNEHAVQHGVGLVVMSTHGRGPVSRFWLGSVADTLVRQAPMPVLLARPQQDSKELLDLTHERAFKHMLIPLDGSRLAEDALQHAMALGTLVQAEYTLLQAIDPIIMDYAPVARSAGLDEDLIEQWRVEAEAYLDQIAGRLRAQSLTVHTAVVLAPPAVAILEHARQHAVDLIAMATHGRTGVSRMLLGSVADKVVRGATAPVLLHRPALYSGGQKD